MGIQFKDYADFSESADVEASSNSCLFDWVSMLRAWTTLKKQGRFKHEGPLKIFAAYVNHCLTCCSVKSGILHRTAASCCRDARGAIGSVDRSIGVAEGGSKTVFEGEMPRYIGRA